MDFRGWIYGLIDLVYPKTCLVCNRRLRDVASIDTVVCIECWQKIKRNVPPFCSRCGRHLEKNTIAKNICPRCSRKALHFDRAFAVCAYEGAIKKLIHAFKYRGKEYLGQTLGRLMLEFIEEYTVPMWFIDAIIPVPLHSARLREREFNQASVLGKFIGEKYDKKLMTGILMRHRHTKSQTELEESERLANVKESFSVRDGTEIRGKTILLIDDVLTTGATCSEAAQALKRAGAQIVFVMTLAN